MIYLEIDPFLLYYPVSDVQADYRHHSQRIAAFSPPRRDSLDTKCKSYAQVQREAAAYREAGHAAAAWSHGILLEPLSIKKRGENIKENAWNQPLLGIDPHWIRAAQPDMLVERLAFVCLAGPVAERLHFPRGPREPASRKRIQNAKTLLGHLLESREACLEKKRKLEAQAAALFKRRDVWASVEELAHILMSRGTMSGKTTVRILEKSR
jgi:hypothetical protein